MQRNLNPKAQAELIATFLSANGGATQHTKVLELVARLNGAATWNELERKKPIRDSALTSKVKSLLAPWAKMFGLEKELLSFQPDEHKRPIESVLRAVFQVTVSDQTGGDIKASWLHATKALETLRDTAQEVLDEIKAKLNVSRVKPRPDTQTCPVYSLKTTMMDEFAPWTILLDGDDVEIPAELYDEFLEVAIVAEAEVEFPRADKYGVPEEATHNGCREWLLEQGFALANGIDISGRDTGCDGMEVCQIAAFVPEELVQRIRMAVAA
jgi:hypothetical protein